MQVIHLVVADDGGDPRYVGFSTRADAERFIQFDARWAYKEVDLDGSPELEKVTDNRWMDYNTHWDWEIFETVIDPQETQ